MRVLNTEQMREADRRTIDEIGIPSIVLMENAGRQAVAAMEAAFERSRRRAASASSAAAATTAATGSWSRARWCSAASTRSCSCSAASPRSAVTRGPISKCSARSASRSSRSPTRRNGSCTSPEFSECDLIVDAILGTGFRGPLSGLLETVVADINSLGLPVVAIDLPTGLSADSAVVESKAIEASMTVTLGAPKIPLVFPPADTLAGDLVIADIGIPYPVFDELEGPYLELLTRERMRELVPARAPDSHKGDFGRVLVVAGSMGRTGAAHLAALGALRSGAGLVTVATPRSCVPIVAAMAPEYMTEALDETPTGGIDFAAVDRVLDLKADVIAIGPGLGQAPARWPSCTPCVERAGVPLVLDADALNAFAGDPERLTGRDGVDMIITPHPGEMARLLNTSIEDDSARSPAARPGIRRRAPRARRSQRASHGDRRRPTADPS